MKTKTKKLTLAELAEKHGIPKGIGKSHRHEITLFDEDGHYPMDRSRSSSDWNADPKEYMVNEGQMARLVSRGYVIPSNRITCTSGYIWQLKGGPAAREAIIAFNIELKAQNERVVQSA